MKLHLCVDRFEGDKKQIAVLVSDDGDQINVPRHFLPKGAQAGDVLSLAIERDEKATQKLAQETRSVQEELKRTDPGGDLTL